MVLEATSLILQTHTRNCIVHILQRYFIRDLRAHGFSIDGTKPCSHYRAIAIQLFSISRKDEALRAKISSYKSELGFLHRITHRWLQSPHSRNTKFPKAATGSAPSSSGLAGAHGSEAPKAFKCRAQTPPAKGFPWPISPSEPVNSLAFDSYSNIWYIFFNLLIFFKLCMCLVGGVCGVAHASQRHRTPWS